MTKEIKITKDKDIIRKMIFEGTEETAIEMCKEISKDEYGLYDGFSGFGLYLHKARLENPEKATKLAKRLKQMLDGKKEETHHVWIVLQLVMTWLAGQASDDFKNKVKPIK